MLTPRRRPAAAQRGASLVEVMVSVAIGLIIVAGAVALFTTQLSATRRTLLEARLNQDLRSAADLVARDLRRASYWQGSLDGTTAVGSGSATTPNPYRVVQNSTSSVAYGFSRDDEEDNELGDAEQFGFRLTDDGMLQMQTEADTWSDLVDPALVRVTAFEITPREIEINLGDLCPKVCLPGDPNCPSTKVRHFDLLLRGQAVADTTVTRELRLAVRLRNDQLEGACSS
jgi:prepilin peptidase dependent protein B